MFKSQLQEYTQKAGLPAPVYEKEKEGPSHEPQFKAKVTILDKVYESPRLFGSLKKAEHAAAEVALAALGKSETGPLHESGLCKNLLQEYAQKTKLPLPVYFVEKSGESHTPIFSATVEIAGVHYNGGKCKTKKEAEIRAARTALVAIYADSGAYPLDATEDQTKGATEDQTKGATEDQTVEEPASVAGQATAEPKYRGKRKKKFKYADKRRKQKVNKEQTGSAEEVGNMETHVDDSKLADPSPETLAGDSKQADPSFGTVADDSKQADPSSRTLADDSTQVDPSPGILADDSKQMDPSATGSGHLASWVPEQEHVGTATESCTIANSKVTACANGSAQEQQA